MFKQIFAAAIVAIGLASGASAQTASEWTVRPEWVRAHESFLASDALQGRGSATRDEAIAAAYVASQFEGYGLKPAPGMTGYTQTAHIVRMRLEGEPVLANNGLLLEHATMLIGSGAPVTGQAVRYSGKPADVAIAADPEFSLIGFLRSDASDHVKLLIVRESDETRALLSRFGGHARLPSYLEGSEPRGGVTVVTLPQAAFDAAVRNPGKIALALPGLRRDVSTTTNAIGYLAGTDPQAGVLLFSAHLDHLGLQPDGTIMPGANDDASGTTAVLELAHALASGKAPRRGILFVAYGSEEIGGYGSRWFGAHPPLPLSQFVANVEFEMIGAQDPKLPAGQMMMTGFERSNLGEVLKAHGALVTADPYPEEHFFQRSDNYQLALQGVVAHTIGGWALVPTYHKPTDTLANLDIAFMTRAIQSLIGPAWWLANDDFVPAWKPGGRPSE
jgi:aminopeptidase YwaD